MRPRPAIRRSYRKFGSKRKNFATTAICHSRATLVEDIGIRWYDHETNLVHYLYEVEHGKIYKRVFATGSCIKKCPGEYC